MSYKYIKIIFISIAISLSSHGLMGQGKADDILREATEQTEKGNTDSALSLYTMLIESQPDTSAIYKIAYYYQAVTEADLKDKEALQRIKNIADQPPIKLSYEGDFPPPYFYWLSNIPYLTSNYMSENYRNIGDVDLALYYLYRSDTVHLREAPCGEDNARIETELAWDFVKLYNQKGDSTSAMNVMLDRVFNVWMEPYFMILYLFDYTRNIPNFEEKIEAAVRNIYIRQKSRDGHSWDAYYLPLMDREILLDPYCYDIRDMNIENLQTAIKEHYAYLILTRKIDAEEMRKGLLRE